MYAEKTDYDDNEMSSRLRDVLRRDGFSSLDFKTCPFFSRKRAMKNR